MLFQIVNGQNFNLINHQCNGISVFKQKDINYIIPSIFSKKSNYENEQSKDFVWYRHKYLALKRQRKKK